MLMRIHVYITYITDITEQLLSSPPPTVNTPTHNYQTPETTNIIGYVITATVTAMSTILIIVIIFVLVKKKQGKNYQMYVSYIVFTPK
jgi:hypothetical protein